MAAIKPVYRRGEDHFRIAAESTPADVLKWADDWYNLLALEVFRADKRMRRVERFLLCNSRLAAVARLQKLHPNPLDLFGQETAVALSAGRLPTRADSHLTQAEAAVAIVESWARGAALDRGVTPPAAPKSKPPSARRRKRKGKGRQLKGKPLTDKQRRVCEKVAEASGNKSAAARQLGLDVSTVRQQYKAAMEKLGRLASGGRPKAPKRSCNPADLEMGARSDGRTRRQHKRPDGGAHEE